MRKKFQAGFGQFKIDSDIGLYMEGKGFLHLAPKQLSALCLLVRRAGQVVSKEEIVKHVWHAQGVSDDSIARCMLAIKKCLKQASPGAENLIKVEYGRGYRFVGQPIGSQSFINEECFYTLIDISPDFIAIKDGDGRWLAVNKVGVELFELAGKPWQGKTDLELSDLVPKFRASFESWVGSDDAAWKAGETSYTMERIYVDGVTKVFQVAKSPVLGARGERKMLVVLGRNVTDVPAGS